MVHTMFMKTVFMMASVVGQATQCPRGSESPSDDEPNNVVALLQTKLKMDASKGAEELTMPLTKARAAAVAAAEAHAAAAVARAAVAEAQALAAVAEAREMTAQAEAEARAVPLAAAEQDVRERVQEVARLNLSIAAAQHTVDLDKSETAQYNVASAAGKDDSKHEAQEAKRDTAVALESENDEVLHELTEVQVALEAALQAAKVAPLLQAALLTISLIVVLYWRKGSLVIVRVLIHLVALFAVKATGKLVEDGNLFKFPLFLTAVHFASGAVIAFTLLFCNSLFNGAQFERPSTWDFGTKFGPIAVAFVAYVSMTNMALLFSTTAFVETIGMSAPVVTVLMALAMKTSFDIKLLTPCLVVFIGAALVSTGEPHFSMLGLMLAAGSNLPYAFQTILQQTLLQKVANAKVYSPNAKVYSPIAVLGWTCLPSSMIMFAWSFFQEGPKPYHQMYGQGFVSQLTVAILLSAVSACILNAAFLFIVKDLGAVGTQIVAQTQAMLVVLGGMCLLKEQVSRMEFLGVILVMVGVFTYNELESWPKKSKAPGKSAGQRPCMQGGSFAEFVGKDYKPLGSRVP